MVDRGPRHGWAALAAWLAMAVVVGGASAGRTWYAKSDATGLNDGSSWEDAFTDLRLALANLGDGDTLYTDAPRGRPFVGAHMVGDFDRPVHGFVWIGDAGPSGQTWMTGARNHAGEWTRQGEVFVATIGEEPGEVVYNFRPDTDDGLFTGTNVREHEALLARFGRTVAESRAWYGFLRRAEGDVLEDGQWLYANGVLFVDPPGSRPSMETFERWIGVCAVGQNAVDVHGEGWTIRGLTGLLYPDPTNNAGYIIKGNSARNATIEECTAIAPGWHSFGFSVNSRDRNTMRRLLTVSMRSGRDGLNGVANPYVFYTPDRIRYANHVGEDLVFIAVPFFDHLGLPTTSYFAPVLGLSHGIIGRAHGGITWRRCLMVDASMGAGIFSEGSLLNCSASGITYDRSDPAEWPFTAEDCVAVGMSALPTPDIRFVRTVFDRSGVPSRPNAAAVYLNRPSDVSWHGRFEWCLFRTGQHQEYYFSHITPNDSLTFDACTFELQAVQDDVTALPFMLTEAQPLGRVVLSRNVVRRADGGGANGLFSLSPDAWTYVTGQQTGGGDGAGTGDGTHPGTGEGGNGFGGGAGPGDSGGPGAVISMPFRSDGSNVFDVRVSAIVRERYGNGHRDRYWWASSVAPDSFRGASACVADFEPFDKPDGDLDVLDILEYFSWFSAGHPIADVNGDLRIDVADILAYFTAYASGC